MEKRLFIADTDEGKEMLQKVDDLNELIAYFRSGKIREHEAH